MQLRSGHRRLNTLQEGARRLLNYPLFSERGEVRLTFAEHVGNLVALSKGTPIKNPAATTQILLDSAAVSEELLTSLQEIVETGKSLRPLALAPALKLIENFARESDEISKQAKTPEDQREYAEIARNLREGAAPLFRLLCTESRYSGQDLRLN